jgi:hypothetical protein
MKRARGRHVSFSLAIIAATAALAGCGGGSASTGSTASSRVAATSRASSTAAQTPPTTHRSSTGTVLSPRQLVVSAGAICERVNAELAAVQPKSASLAEIIRIVPRRAASERKAAAELSKLVPPPALSRDWSSIVAYRSALASELAQLVRAAQGKDRATIKALAASKSRAHARLLRTAERAGLTVCGHV